MTSFSNVAFFSAVSSPLSVVAPVTPSVPSTFVFLRSDSPVTVSLPFSVVSPLVTVRPLSISTASWNVAFPVVVSVPSTFVFLRSASSVTVSLPSTFVPFSVVSPLVTVRPLSISTASWNVAFPVVVSVPSTFVFLRSASSVTVSLPSTFVPFSVVSPLVTVRPLSIFTASLKSAFPFTVTVFAVFVPRMTLPLRSAFPEVVIVSAASPFTSLTLPWLSTLTLPSMVV